MSEASQEVKHVRSTLAQAFGAAAQEIDSTLPPANSDFTVRVGPAPELLPQMEIWAERQRKKQQRHLKTVVKFPWIFDDDSDAIFFDKTDLFSDLATTAQVQFPQRQSRTFTELLSRPEGVKKQKDLPDDVFFYDVDDESRRVFAERGIGGKRVKHETDSKLKGGLSLNTFVGDIERFVEERSDVGKSCHELWRFEDLEILRSDKSLLPVFRELMKTSIMKWILQVDTIVNELILNAGRNPQDRRNSLFFIRRDIPGGFVVIRPTRCTHPTDMTFFMTVGKPVSR